MSKAACVSPRSTLASDPSYAPSEHARKLRADLSDRGFLIGLYLEHVEEASFLYEQRLALLEDSDLRWPDLAEFEDRLEAHLDALVLGGQLALAVCQQEAAHGDPGERYVAANVICRHGRPDVLREVLGAIGVGGDGGERAVGRSPLPGENDVLATAIATGPAAHRAVEVGRPDQADQLLALGFLGDVDAINHLVTCLENEATAPAAAAALQLITGAALDERATLSSIVRPDELFDDELPLGASNPAPATRARVTRLSRDPRRWRAWWTVNAKRFVPSFRYRVGAPYSATVVVDTIADERASRRIRELAYYELVTRFGADIPFDTTMLVSQQRQAIARLRAWAVERAAPEHIYPRHA